MSVMASNEVLSTAVLTVRKSGGMDPLPYLTVTLGKARITDYTLSSELSDEGAPVVMESLSLTFQTVTIDYTQQSETGASLGSSSFAGETAPA
jgi:type VI secretion system secreted protein Hcp